MTAPQEIGSNKQRKSDSRKAKRIAFCIANKNIPQKQDDFINIRRYIGEFYRNIVETT